MKVPNVKTGMLIYHRYFILFIFGLITIGLASCKGPESPRGFRLPDGDAPAGNMMFVQMGCHACHTVRRVELPPAESKGPVEVELGGDVTRVKTYGELVTAIINPSHRFASGYPVEEISSDGESLMPDFNSRMTVQQLIDLVAFLQPQYKVVLPEYEYVPYLVVRARDAVVTAPRTAET